MCVCGSCRFCHLDTTNALVVFQHRVPADHQDPGRRSGLPVAAKRYHYRYLRTLQSRETSRELSLCLSFSPSASPFSHNAACRYCPATNVLIKFIGRPPERAANVNGFRATGGLAVGSKRQQRQQMSHSRWLRMVTPSTL